MSRLHATLVQCSKPAEVNEVNADAVRNASIRAGAARVALVGTKNAFVRTGEQLMRRRGRDRRDAGQLKGGAEAPRPRLAPAINSSEIAACQARVDELREQTRDLREENGHLRQAAETFAGLTKRLGERFRSNAAKD